MTDDWFNYSDPYSPTSADYWLDHHPRTYEQWKRQQWIRENIPLFGQLYGSYLDNKANVEYIEQTMQNNDIDWSEISNPYHSSLLNQAKNGPNYVGAGISVSRNISRLYK